MPSQAQTQEVSCSLDELKAGIKLKAGHAVVFVVSDGAGTRLPQAAGDETTPDDIEQPAAGSASGDGEEAAAGDSAGAGQPAQAAQPESTPSVSVTLELSGDAASDPRGAPAQEALTLKWKVSGAASASLAAQTKPGDPVLRGVTEDGGRIRLAIDPQNALPNMLTMEDGDDELVWEFELSPPPRDENAAKPDAAGDSAQVSFAALLRHGIDLTVDGDGNGAGTLVIDPGPDCSIVLQLTAQPKDTGKEPVLKELSVAVSNFDIILMLDDQTAAPPGRQCTFSTQQLAGAGEADGASAAA